jgi:hypothetical protein
VRIAALVAMTLTLGAPVDHAASRAHFSGVVDALLNASNAP